MTGVQTCALPILHSFPTRRSSDLASSAPPPVTRHWHCLGWTDGKPRPAIKSSLLVVGVPAVLAAAVVAVLPGLVLAVLYGSGTFPGAEPVTSVLAIVAGLSAFVSVLVHAGMARNRWTMWLPWFGALLEIVVISTWHSTGTAVAAGSAAAGALVLVLLVVFELPAWRSGNPR